MKFSLLTLLALIALIATAHFDPALAGDGAVLSSGTPGCGDANGSGAVDIDDVVFLIGYIFVGGPAPDPYQDGDADCSGNVDIDDVVYLIGYIFSGGPEPCAYCYDFEFIVSIVENGLRGAIDLIGSGVELAPSLYRCTLISSTVALSPGDDPWEGVFLFTRETVNLGCPTDDYWVSLNGAGDAVQIDYSAETGPVWLYAYFTPGYHYDNATGSAVLRVKDLYLNDSTDITASVADNSLVGGISAVSSNIVLDPGVYEFWIEWSSARFLPDHCPWQGLFLFTHELDESGNPAPNYMTTLNGIRAKTTIDFSNHTGPITIQGYFTPHVPTEDDSGEVLVRIRVVG